MTSELNEDFLAHDLIYSFFMVALNSYRFDSVLRPFPPKYIDANTQIKNVQKLKNVASKVPCVSDACKLQNDSSNLEALELFNWVTRSPTFKLKYHDKSKKNVASKVPCVSDACKLQNDSSNLEALELFNWVTRSPTFKLKYHDKSKFSVIQELTKQEMATSVPHHIFEVSYSKERELKFEALRNEYDTIHAYHGSRADNFHSILYHGLVSHFNKNGLFGHGTYFSSELSVSLNYSPFFSGWEKSLLGPRLSCVAVCEIVNHPSIISREKESHSKPISEDRIGDKIPEKYYIVANNDLVRIRYLLVYVFGTIVSKRTKTRWWQNYKFPLLMFSYFMLLLIVGLSNCSVARRFLTKMFM